MELSSFGWPDSGYLQQVRYTADSYGLPYEILDAADVQRRYPQHHLEADQVAFLDLQAGLLHPEKAVRAATARAAQLGARVVTKARVEAIEEHGDRVEIRTRSASYSAGQAIIAVGAWTGKLLPGLKLPLWIERQVMVWFRADRPEDFAPERFPVFIRDRGGQRTWYGFPSWYGFPTVDGATVKVAIHHEGPTADTDDLDREIHSQDLEPVQALVRSSLPGLDPMPVQGKVCMYTNTPDGHFVIGRPSGMKRLLLGPMAGHGFKFATTIGKIGADLATSGSTDHSIDGFSPDRFEMID